MTFPAFSLSSQSVLVQKPLLGETLVEMKVRIDWWHQEGYRWLLSLKIWGMSSSHPDHSHPDHHHPDHVLGYLDYPTRIGYSYWIVGCPHTLVAVKDVKPG